MPTYTRDDDTKPSASPAERLVAKLPERIQRQPLITHYSLDYWEYWR